MEVQASDAEPIESDSPVVIDEHKLPELIASASLTFQDWTSLISEVDAAFSDDIEKLGLVYDAFLLEFPLCYGYWRKYANHAIRLCTVGKVVELFERAVGGATYCVDLWVDYCSFGSLVFEDPADVRRLFQRGLSYVGKDYPCHALWDKYIEFELSQQHWSSLAHIYIQTLRFPTRKLNHYYENFKKLVKIWEEARESHSNSASETPIEPVPDSEVPTCYKEADISCIIKDLLDPSIGLAGLKALQKYIHIGEQLYQEASQLNEKISCFETRIRRPYFHVLPLDISQLENWHHYLDFAELHGDFDWAVKLYERCLIPCANYPEFWMRYVEFMESKGGREIANFALDRATQIYLKRISAIHLASARFKEYIGDAPKARAALLHCDADSDSDTDFVENVIMKANMERRLGNLVAASNIYTEAIEKAAAEQKAHTLPILYIHCSRLKHMTVDNEDAARDILIDGIKHVPYCKVLIEELIKFAMALKGSRHITVVDSVVSKAIAPGPGESQGLSVEEGEHISRLYIEFVDLCGTINDVRKAWNRHIRLFPHSVRTTCSSVTGTKRWKVSKEEKQENLDTLPPQDSGEEMSDFLILSSMQEKEQGPLPETPDSQAADPATKQMPDQKSPLLENHEMLSDSGEDTVKPCESGEGTVKLCDSGEDTVKPCESGESDSNKKMKLDCASHRDSEEQSAEDDPKPNSSLVSVNEVTDATEGPQAVLEFSKENSVLEQSDYEPEPELKPPSLDGLSLDTLDAKSADPLTAKSHDFEAPQGMASVPPTPSEFEAPQEPSNMQKSEARQENSMSSEFEAPQELSFPNRNMQKSEARQENSMSSEFEAPQELSFPNRNMQKSEACQENSMLNEFEAPQELSFPNRNMQKSEARQENSMLSEFEAPQELSFPNRNMQKNEARQENSMSSDFESPQELSFSNRNMQKSEARQENSMSNGSLPESSKYATVEESSPASTPATVSALINTENLSPSASASNLNIMAPAVSRPQMSEHRGRNWHQRSNPDRFRRDSKYGFRGNSHRRSHQPQQASPHQQYPRAERGSRLPTSQGYPSQPASSQNPQGQQGSGMQSQYYEPVAQGNLAPTQAWSTQGTQQQNPSAPCQSQQPVQPGTFPQPQMSQYPVQGNEQQGSLPNNQVYNQMWQYYYYQQQQQQQQQLLWQQQQQQQQQQQPQDQQLLQQQYQQQMLQMQYLQQQLQQQQLPPQQQQEQLQLLLQQQQQQFLLQQQQLQLQPQQASQLEQQLIQQQTNLHLQPQQASQLQQQLLQQHTNQQHLLYMQHQQLQLHLQQQQQQQAMSSQKQQHEQEQGNHAKD